MALLYAITFGSLASAVALTCFIESAKPELFKMSKFLLRLWIVLVGATSVGAASLIISYVFGLGPWPALTLGLIPGLSFLAVAARLSG